MGQNKDHQNWSKTSMAHAYPTDQLYPGQMWEDDQGNVREVFSVWRGAVTYGFVKAMGGEFGSDACDEVLFKDRYAYKYRPDLSSVEDYLLHLSQLAIKEVVKKHREEGLVPPRAYVKPEYPQRI